MWRTACRNARISSLAALPLAGCASSGGGACPPLAAYAPQVQRQAAGELLALRKDSTIAVMIVD